jgi:glutathione synthase/RimK-type ligase-like ATP-grasp enzyme
MRLSYTDEHTVPRQLRVTRIALATCDILPELWAGDRLFLDELRRRGFTSAPVVWDDPRVDWDAWDAVVIRSCWDYHLKIDRFRAWLDRAAANGRVVINPPALVGWNLHKGYLLDVARAGGTIPPTRVLPRCTPGTLREHLEREGWRDAVIKPAVSASGQSTRLIRGRPTEEDERRFAETIAAGDVLAQAYVPEVREHGEWSLVFFEGRYSHAALKRAAPGEFRVHIEWGGTVESGEPPARLVADAQALITALDLQSTYARVDGTDVGGALIVMELEVIEPELFFDQHPEAAARLARAVERVLQSRT